MSDSPPPRRALITGATGYIGSNLVHHLLVQGWDIHIVIRPNSNLQLLDTVLNNVTVHQHDGTSSSMIALLANAKPDIVFHLASLFLAQHKAEDIEALISSNLLFSTQLVEAMAVNGVRYLINTGTSWQHYNNEAYNPVNLYAATKEAFEVILDYYVKAKEVSVISLILFDTYGPNDPRQKLISLLAKTSKSKEPLAMSLGEQLLDLVHIDDVIEAYLCAVNAILDQESGSRRYGVSTGQPIRLKDLVRTYEQATGVSLPIQWGLRPYRDREVMVPWTNFEPVPGWQPKICLEEGLRSLMFEADGRRKHYADR